MLITYISQPFETKVRKDCYKEKFGVNLPETKKPSDELKKICKNPEVQPKEKSEEERKKHSAFLDCIRTGIIEEMKKIHPNLDEKGLRKKFFDLLDEVIFFVVLFVNSN